MSRHVLTVCSAASACLWFAMQSRAEPLPGAKPAAFREDPHAKLFAVDSYPSATKCMPCHQTIYDEWRSSAHAYAAISPVFHKFEQKLNDLTQGTVGTFCVRCHSGVGTQMGEKRHLPLWERTGISREGVTCITCHRVNEAYGKVNGERRIEPGNIFQPMYGSGPGEGMKTVLEDQDGHKVRTSPQGRGTEMHDGAIRFEQISKSEFCLSCHQVAVHPGIKLEVVWDQYRCSPAFRKGARCHDCHMGKIPGRDEGYEERPAAVVNGREILPPRKHHNHAFYGPGYPTAHPGIFPHHPEAGRFPVQAWLEFDYRGKWGSGGFEGRVGSGEVQAVFPQAWADPIDREDAWKIVEENLDKLRKKRELRRQLMENGSRIDGPSFADEPRAGRSLRFSYEITNLNPGHNLPSGSLGAQPEIWLNVALVGPDGKNLWESGYLDANGDMADLHSLEVAAGRIAHDDQLFNLQTKFLTTTVKGTDREVYLPVNFDIDPLPFIRPAAQPVSVMNHPPFIRMENRSLPPLGSRKAHYTVPASVMARAGTYRLAVRLRSRAEPIYFMRFIGATVDMERAMNEWMLDIHSYTVEFEVR